MFEPSPLAPPSIISVATVRQDIDSLKPSIVAIRALLTMEDGTKQILRKETLDNLQKDLKANEIKLRELEDELTSLEKLEIVSTPT